MSCRAAFELGAALGLALCAAGWALAKEPPELAELKRAFVDGRLAEKVPDTRQVRERIADLERLTNVHPGVLWQAKQQIAYYFKVSGDQLSGETGKAEVSPGVERDLEEAQDVLDRAAGLNFPTLAEEFLYETGFADLLYFQQKWKAAAAAYEPYVSEKDYFDDMRREHGRASLLFRDAFFRWVEASDRVIEEGAFESVGERRDFLARRYEILTAASSWDPSLRITRPEIGVAVQPEEPLAAQTFPSEEEKP